MTDLPQCRIRELQFERQKAKEELAELNKGMEGKDGKPVRIIGKLAKPC